MPDIRDLICTAERLEANGFTRRAAAAWRKVATHPETPKDIREKVWRAAGCSDDYSEEESAGRGRPRKAITEQMRQMSALCAKGVKRKEIAAMFNTDVSTVARANKAVNLEKQRRRLLH